MKSLITVEMAEIEGVKKLRWQSAEQSVDVLDQLIDLLGKARAEITPPVRQSDPEPGHRVEVVADPRWFLGVGNGGETILTFRHPGFGWVAFQLPDESKERLRKMMA